MNCRNCNSAEFYEFTVILENDKKENAAECIRCGLMIQK